MVDMDMVVMATVMAMVIQPNRKEVSSQDYLEENKMNNTEKAL